MLCAGAHAAQVAEPRLAALRVAVNRAVPYVSEIIEVMMNLEGNGFDDSLRPVGSRFLLLSRSQSCWNPHVLPKDL